MTIDEETIERACYNAMRRREQEISDANGKQGKYFREQEESVYILSQAETFWLKQQEKKRVPPNQAWLPWDVVKTNAIVSLRRSQTAVD